MRPPRTGRPSPTKRKASTRSSLLREYKSLKTTLISNMKRGSFTPHDLLEPAQRMERLLPRVFGSQRSKQDRAELFKIRAYLSEIYYIFDLKDQARKVLSRADIERLPSELFDHSKKLSAGDCALYREKIRAYLAYIQAHHYSRENYEKAADEFRRCVRIIKERLMRDHGFRSDSTLALCYYNLGRALRQRSQHPAAMRAFGDALTYFHRRYQARLKMYDEKETQLRRRKKPSHASLERLRERRKDEMMMFHHRSGLVFGRGMAWSNYARGELIPALAENIVPATAFLDETKDAISKAYLQLIESTILRNLSDVARPEKRRDNLERAEQLLKEAITIFREDHPSYESRAMYELSIVLLYKRQFDAALKEINKVIKRVEGKSARWYANSLVYRAKIRSYGSQQESWPLEKRREQLQEALADAHTAMSKAPGQSTCMIDSLIVQADSYLQLVDLCAKSAPSDSERWLKESEKVLNKLSNLNAEMRNTRTDAYCYLYSTLHALEGDNLDEAARCRSKWLAIKPQLKDDWPITELALLMEEKMQQVKDRSFVVTVVDSLDGDRKAQFDFLRWRRELLVYLVKQAKSRGVIARKEIWKLLNIDSNIYYSTRNAKARSRKRHRDNSDGNE
jgi:tetratricopeptide (TPR) repeat protein